MMLYFIKYKAIYIYFYFKNRVGDKEWIKFRLKLSLITMKITLIELGFWFRIFWFGFTTFSNCYKY